MKTSKRTSASQKLISEIRLARLQLAKVQSQLKSARKQARAAKRRRKEAKQAARRARKQAKLAKRAVTEAKQVLAEAQKKLARARRRKVVAASGKRATNPAAPGSPKSMKPMKPRPGASGLGPAVQPTGGIAQAVAAPQTVVEPAVPKSPAPASSQPLPPNQAVP
jgi:hypothetical protein